ncbi:MAG: hypothetical protein CUN55_18815 [Phototrophicales bacterium]|nr:MAG: hypothetical protein CUN55_18815 [Phototrophicales bacterium]
MEHYKGVIVNKDNEDIFAIAELLAVRVRNRLTYDAVPTPANIDTRIPYHFIILASLRTIKEVVQHYQRANQKPPLIIHIVYGEQQNQLISYKDFPDIDIAPIVQASLDQQDTTLQLDLFERVLKILDDL